MVMTSVPPFRGLERWRPPSPSEGRWRAGWGDLRSVGVPPSPPRGRVSCPAGDERLGGRGPRGRGRPGGGPF